MGVFTCFGMGDSSEEERQPLLPQYRDDTERQTVLHEKLHTYQMLSALRQGFMPSTEQAVANLRCLLSADILNPTDPGLSHSGHRLTQQSKEVLKDFITLFQNKNREDQLQDLLWLITQSRIHVDVNHLSRTASKAKAKADVSAG